MNITIEIGGVQFSTNVSVTRAGELLDVLTEWFNRDRFNSSKAFDRFFDDVDQQIEDARQD